MDSKEGLLNIPIKLVKNIILKFSLRNVRSIHSLIKREIVMDQIKSLVANKTWYHIIFGDKFVAKDHTLE